MSNKPALLTVTGAPVEEWARPHERGMRAFAEGEEAAEPIEFPQLPTPPKDVRARPDQKSLTSKHWEAFIEAIDTIASNEAESPTYQNLVDIHVRAMDHEGMGWGVHTMPSMHTLGRNFLAWHRLYLVELERRLRHVDPDVILPYWNWANDREIPKQLAESEDLRQWRISRQPEEPSKLPSGRSVNPLFMDDELASFSSALESGPHNRVHIWVGGTMATSASPADPIFWLHHAFIDKIWTHWQAAHPGSDPSNPDEELQPPPIIRGSVEHALNTQAFGYTYA